MKKLVCCLFPILLVLPLCLTACSPGQGAASGEVPRQESQVEESALSSQASVLESSQPDESAVSSSAEGRPEREMSEREKNWREDFAFFKQRYLMKHTHPFYYVSEEEFDFQVEQLSQKVDRLSDLDVYFEFSKIVAGLGDNHTALSLPDNYFDQIFAVGTRYFGEKLYLCGYARGYEQFAPYQLHEIVAVNGVDIKYLKKKADSIYSPTNAWYGQKFFDQGMFQPLFVDWATSHAKDEYTLQVLDDDGRAVSLELPVIPYEPYTKVEVVKPENWEKLPRLQETGVSYFETEKGSFVYLAFIGSTAYDRGDFYKELIQQTADLLKEHLDSKLVVDLREYFGGDEKVVLDVESEIPPLKEICEPKTYVITGGSTTSAAIMMMQVFKEKLRAVQVGEPTGQFTSLWGTYRTCVLPHSRIFSGISTQYLDRPNGNTHYDENGKLYEWENTVLPDVYVSMDVEDVKEGKDTVIEWILEH